PRGRPLRPRGPGRARGGTRQRRPRRVHRLRAARLPGPHPDRADARPGHRPGGGRRAGPRARAGQLPGDDRGRGGVRRAARVSVAGTADRRRPRVVLRRTRPAPAGHPGGNHRVRDRRQGARNRYPGAARRPDGKNSGKDGAGMAELSPTEIAPGVHVATAEKYTTTTTIVAGADGGCLLVDPAVSVADLAALAGWLSDRGLRPVAGWSTHPHWDHLLWSRALGAAPRYATPPAVAVAAREQAALISAVEDGA